MTGPKMKLIRESGIAIQKYSTLELHTAYLEVVGKCRKCGQEYDPSVLTRYDLESFFVADRRFYHSNRALSEQLELLAKKCTCETCAKGAKHDRRV